MKNEENEWFLEDEHLDKLQEKWNKRWELRRKLGLDCAGLEGDND
jgi:hypothetical protein